MGEVATVPAPTFSELRREQREREYKKELRDYGIHTRELVLMQREAMMENAEYWHAMAEHRGRCAMEYAALAILNARRVVEQQREIERLRGMIE